MKKKKQEKEDEEAKTGLTEFRKQIRSSELPLYLSLNHHLNGIDIFDVTNRQNMFNVQLCLINAIKN